MKKTYYYKNKPKELTKKEKILSVAETILPWLMYYDYLLPFKYWNKKKDVIHFVSSDDYKNAQQIAIIKYKDLHEKVFKKLLKQL